MENILSILARYIDVFFIGAFLGGALLLVPFKKRVGLIAVLLVAGIGGFYLFDQMKYTTFSEIVSKQLNETSTVRNITIYMKDPSEEYRVSKAHITIEDEVIIQKILEDFSDMELKRELSKRGEQRQYYITILTTNPKDDILVTDSFSLVVDKHYVNEYKIVNGTNHLKTIEELTEREDIDWEED